MFCKHFPKFLRNTESIPPLGQIIKKNKKNNNILIKIIFVVNWLIQ